MFDVAPLHVKIKECFFKGAAVMTKVINCNMVIERQRLFGEKKTNKRKLFWEAGKGGGGLIQPARKAWHKSALTFRCGLLLPLWINNNKPILLHSTAELSFNAGPTNNINPVPAQLCTVWGEAGKRRRRWTIPIACGLYFSQPAGVIGSFLTWTTKVISQWRPWN